MYANQPIDQNVVCENDRAESALSDHTTGKSWAKYTPKMLRRPGHALLKRPFSAASSHSESADSSGSLLQLKKKLIERELAMREEEHEKRMAQQKFEHDARIDLIYSQKEELREKSALRQIKMKIASLVYKDELVKRSLTSSSESD